MKGRDIRPMSTVIINEKEKTALLRDTKTFLDPRARAWYSNRGIPYRRGYLLYEQPGTGKSSLSLLIASCYDLEIYVLNISNVDGDSLGTLFTELPPRCVLLKDVDAVGMTKSWQAETEKTGQTEAGSAKKTESKGKSSLLDLLDALDGV